MKEFRIKTGGKIPCLSPVSSKNDVLHKVVRERRNCPKRCTSRFATLLTQSSKDNITERSNAEASDIKSENVNEDKDKMAESFEGLRKDSGNGSSFDETLSSLDALLEQTAVQDKNGNAFNLTEAAAPDLPKTGRLLNLEACLMCL